MSVLVPNTTPGAEFLDIQLGIPEKTNAKFFEHCGTWSDRMSSFSFLGLPYITKAVRGR